MNSEEEEDTKKRQIEDHDELAGDLGKCDDVIEYQDFKKFNMDKVVIQKAI